MAMHKVANVSGTLVNISKGFIGAEGRRALRF